ncbi:MAG TPA: GNAT family N-acetyltransferase [Phycisphaerae bacterium]|nr:GNAT family N-acetyltransferase [Phycisphaerae bacterium]
MQQSQLIPVLQRIEADTARMLRAERESVEVGPFLAAFHRASDMVWLNFAVPIGPTDDAESVRRALPLLREEFERRNRVLRFEYLAARHPALAGQLEDLGLTLQLAAPLMICTPGDLRAIAPPACELHQLDGDAADSDLADFVRVGKMSFGATPVSVEAHEIEGFREALRQGRWKCLLARDQGAAIGVGTFCIGNSELAGVGTLPQFRRQGVAAAVSSRLLADHFAAGGIGAWLSAGTEIARALYLKVGFQDAGVQLNYIEGSSSPT